MRVGAADRSEREVVASTKLDLGMPVIALPTHVQEQSSAENSSEEDDAPQISDHSDVVPVFEFRNSSVARQVHVWSSVMPGSSYLY